jgi:hypothetical protein
LSLHGGGEGRDDDVGAPVDFAEADELNLGLGMLEKQAAAVAAAVAGAAAWPDHFGLKNVVGVHALEGDFTGEDLGDGHGKKMLKAEKLKPEN